MPRAELHARLFRLFLRAYPRPFREIYGAEMTRFFLDRLARARDAGGRGAVLRQWARAAADVAKTAAAERWGGRVRRTEPMKGREFMTSMLQDVRYAARRLRRTPLFTSFAIAILGVGIGLNAAVFNLVDTVLFRPSPFADPAEIVHIYQDSDDGEPSSTSFPAYREMAELTGIFAGVAATSPDKATWEDTDGPRPVSVEYATASYFPVLGLRPYRGRWFDTAHDRVGAELVAVVSYRTWRTRMGADPGVIGSTIRLNNQAVTIIGIGPKEFNGEAGALATDFWLSISSAPVGGPFRVANLDRRQDHWYLVKARLAPGVSVERARAAMDVLAQRLAEEYPELNEGRGITVFAHDEVRIHPEFDGGLFTAGMGVLVVAGLVLLLACSNLANLLLARGISRGPELAVRQALGSGRMQVARLLLVEALLLAGLGGAAGLGLAAWSVQLIPLLPLSVAWAGLDVGFDHRVVVFGVLLALATGLLSGLLPALRSARTDVAVALRDEGRGQSAGRGASLVRRGLVALQVAVSLVLVIGAGLLTRSLANAQRVAPGVDADRIALVETDLQRGGVSDAEVAVVAAQILERVEALPGVERAALTNRLPVQSGWTSTHVVEGYDPPSGTGSVELPVAIVSRGYFEAMGIPVLAGRTFTADDRPDAPPVIVVNETAARRFWGGDWARGRIRPEGAEGAWRRVVGVVGDVKVIDLREPPTPMIYYSAEQMPPAGFAVVARTSGDPATLLGTLRSTLRDVRPSLPVTRLATLDTHIGGALARLRAVTALLGGFSLLAMLLAGLGVYATVSFAVERRTREMGIRLVMGAAPARVAWMVVRESLTVVAAGVVAGLALATLAVRGVQTMLFGVGSMDGVTFAGASALLLAATGIAALLPARRAARADPVEALKSR
ncbi:MAG TPA: ABC transporter permease [Longimicrobiales bacterium]